MYDELIADLRRHHCNAKEDDTQEVCDECPYDVIIADKSRPNGIASVCVCGLMNRAADALEGLQKRVPPVPHGRLVDADALMHEFEKAQRTMEQHGREYSCSFMSDSCELSTEWYCVEDMLENAPTILEAEEGYQ